jgi:hypothetical protein
MCEQITYTGILVTFSIVLYAVPVGFWIFYKAKDWYYVE